MKTTITQLMIDMNKRNESLERGVFVMSKKTIKQFRKETKRFPDKFLGHKLRTLQGCPDEKIYLMEEDEFAELKSEIFKRSTEMKKESANNMKSNMRKL
jgi:hypothetical protein